MNTIDILSNPTMPISVLDHGYVKYVRHMGDDLSPLEDARMSTRNPTGVDEAKDEGLRSRLWRDAHTSPFESNILCVELRVPIFVLRQIDRHRTVDISNPELDFYVSDYDAFRKFTSRNEFSARYSVMPDLFYLPELERVQLKGTINKQGSEGLAPEEVRREFVENMDEHNRRSRELYEKYVGQGVATELARGFLPPTQYTDIRLQACLLNWYKFFLRRCDSHAQWEVQQYANPIASIAMTLWPRCWSVYEKDLKQKLHLAL